MSEESSNGILNLDVGTCSVFNDFLKVKIITSLPFKSFFRIASSLSKTWRQRVASEWFQTELHNRCSSWESYCPIYAMHTRTGVELVGYESNSKRWRMLPTHSNQTQGVDTSKWVLKAGNGSLFCWTCLYRNSDVEISFKHHVFVTNPLTRSWKQLRLRQDMRSPDFIDIQLEGHKAYKVILGRFRNHDVTFHHRFLIGGRYSMSVEIFDSTHESWTTEVYTTIGTNIVRIFSAILRNGFLHILADTFGSGFILISHNVKEKVWSEIQLQLRPINADPRTFYSATIRFFKILVCGSHVMMVMNYQDNVNNRGFRHVLSVFKLDVEHGIASEESRALAKDLLGTRSLNHDFYTPSAHGDYIYISSDHEGEILVHNVITRLWHWIPFTPGYIRQHDYRRMVPFTYQPGLNPLIQV